MDVDRGVDPSHSKETVTADFETKAEETPEAQEALKGLSITPSSNKENEDVELKEDDDDEESSEEEGSSDDESDDLYDGLSREEVARLKAAMKGIQNDYEQHCDHEEQEMVRETKDVISFNLSVAVSDAEAAFIGRFVRENNVDLVAYLEDEGIQFLGQMKEMMDQQALSGGDAADGDSDGEYEWPDSDDNGDEDWIEHSKRKKAERAKRRAQKQQGSGTNLDGSKRCGRLLLNDALKDVGNMEGWSEARKKAWNNRRTAPNAYFYRFNVPGQPQKNGKWDAEDHRLFMARVLAFGVNDQWGIFSKKIPGRVGYQCSNYWRGLVKDGDVVDPNYAFDGKKLHFKRNTKTFRIRDDYRKFAVTIKKDASGVWTNLPQKHPRHPTAEYCREVEQALSDAVHSSSNSKTKRKRKAKGSDDDDDFQPASKRRRRTNKKRRGGNDDDDFHCSLSSTVQPKDDDENPMSDFIDIMTGTAVVRPAISPYGHVLGYETWTMLLRTSKHKDLCPFTMQRLTRRSLVKLTKENYADYKHKIKNITDEEKAQMALINN